MDGWAPAEGCCCAAKGDARAGKVPEGAVEGAGVGAPSESEEKSYGVNGERDGEQR